MPLTSTSAARENQAEVVGSTVIAAITARERACGRAGGHGHHNYLVASLPRGSNVAALRVGPVALAAGGRARTVIWLDKAIEMRKDVHRLIQLIEPPAAKLSAIDAAEGLKEPCFVTARG